MSINKWMDKEAVVHIYNGILLSHKKECIWVSSNVVDESGAYYIDWNKTERHQQMSYINTHTHTHTHTHIYIYIYTEFRKIVLMNLFARQQWRCRHRKQTSGHSERRRGWNESRWKHRNLYITVCEIDIRWEFAVRHRNLRPVLCDSLERRDMVEGGREVQDVGDMCIPMADLCWHTAKNNKLL